MNAPVAYQYVVLRLVPRIEREEFVNVGVVVHSQEADVLEARFHLDAPRIRALAPDVDLLDLTESLSALCRVASGEDEPGAPSLDRPGQRFGWLAAPRSTMVQPGPVHSGLTDDAPGESLRLLRRLVAAPPAR